jgi:hypothetical protein
MPDDDDARAYHCDYCHKPFLIEKQAPHRIYFYVPQPGCSDSKFYVDAFTRRELIEILRKWRYG